MLSIPLFLSDVAGSEVMVIVLVVLLFFGSKSVPGIAKSLGQALYQIRNASNELQQEIRKSGEDIKKDLNLQSVLKETEESLTQPLDQMYTDLDNTIHYGSMPKQVKQQVTAGNPVVESSTSSTSTNDPNLDQINANS
ncbi:MAG: twin-arginine translocase TatA/TatE family subunit [Flavobacteriales bacterium]